MTHIHNILGLKLRAFLIVSMVFISASFAQTISGPTTVAAGSTHTYSYTDGLFHSDKTWTINGGTETNSWYTKRPLVMYVTVQWGTGSSGQVILDSNGTTLNVTITGGGGPTCPDTSLSNENYVHTLAPRTATTSTSGLANDEKIESVTYFDGLGRAKQSIGIRAGAACEDIVTHVAYDQYGRAEKEYLPFAQSNNGGTLLLNAESLTNTFYTAKYPNDLGTTPNPFSEKDFEASPLNRVFKQAAPGEDWAMGSGHEIELDYQTNDASEVRRYTVNLTLANNTFTPSLDSGAGFYYAGELYKSITRDENHSGNITVVKDHTTEEFKDAEGRVILKRTYNNEVTHDTYYVYDDYGNLTYVLPPKVTHGATISSTELSELGYQYVYDYRNRLVEKKIPGKGWEYILYNKLDQPIATQDANQRATAPYKWNFTKYDAFGRVAYTGTDQSSVLYSRVAMQNAVNNVGPQYEERVPTPISVGGTNVYYTNVSGITSFEETLTVNYYDDYAFDLNGGSSETAYGVTPETNVKSLATGSKVRVLGTSNWITSVTYYDDKARPIYIYSKNDYLNTTDKIKSELTFDGTVTETTTTHARTGFSTITTVDAFTYDHMNRLIDQQQTINSGTAEVIVENTYDELGQLESKGVGGTTAQSRLQTVDYTYNIRGWLKGINDVANMGTDLFGFKINYNTADHGATALFNGNISETEWRTANTDNSLKWYKYSYDDLNRIITGVSHNGNYDLSGIGYDKNGNITSLQRQGHTNAAATSFGAMDNLVYTYEPTSNKLLKVLDNANDTYGFNDGANLTTEYTYDANGNMLTDANKGISSNILYNHLNLPTQVTLSGGNIQYIYDATGVKQKKIVSNGATTYYAGNYIYEGSTLKFFSHPEGYIEPNGSNFDYVYQYKDHLGNIRLAYSDANNDGAVDSSEILEENNYYPFGLKHKGYNNIINGTEHKYKYNGKELEEGLGYNMYEYEARHYDAALGRFVTVDPLAEDYSFQSTYSYSINNPIYFIDKLGMGPSDEWILNNDGSHTWISNKGGDSVDYVHSTDDNGKLVTETIDVVNLVTINNNSEVRTGFGVKKEPGLRTGITGKAPGKGDMNWLEVIPLATTALTVDVSNRLGVDPAYGLAVVTMVNLILNPAGTTTNAIKTSKRGTAGNLVKSKRGKGSVPPSERPKPRMPSKKNQKAQYDLDGGKCQNCGNPTKIENTIQHHYPKRHSDGGSKTTTACEDCHKYLHSKDD